MLPHTFFEILWFVEQDYYLGHMLLVPLLRLAFSWKGFIDDIALRSLMTLVPFRLRGAVRQVGTIGSASNLFKLLIFVGSSVQCPKGNYFYSYAALGAVKQ